MNVQELVSAALAVEHENDVARLVRRIHALGSSDACRVAVDLLEASDVRSRALGADILGQLGAPALPYRRESVAVLTRRLAVEEEAPVIEAIVAALGYLDKAAAATAVPAYGDHPDPGVRRAVAFALQGIDEEAAVTTLARLADDDVDDVRDWAVFALGTQSALDDDEVRDLLYRRSSDASPDVRLEAVVGLARRLDPRAVELLVEQSRDHAGVPAFDEAVIEYALAVADHRLCPALHAVREVGEGKIGAELREAFARCRC
jgi:HEAT repeat protein